MLTISEAGMAACREPGFSRAHAVLVGFEDALRERSTHFGNVLRRVTLRLGEFRKKFLIGCAEKVLDKHVDQPAESLALLLVRIGHGFLPSG
jgi:hypothetical protein